MKGSDHGLPGDDNPEIAELRAQLAEARARLEAIRPGAVDALAVKSAPGEQGFPLAGAQIPFCSLVEAMNEGASLIKEDGTVLYSNSRFAEFLGVTQDNLIGQDWSGHFAASDRLRLRAMVRTARQSPARDSFTLRTSGGGSMLVAVSLSPFKNGTVEAVVAIMTSLVEQKRAEDQLRDANDRLEQRVQQRTVELTRANDRLRREITEREQQLWENKIAAEFLELVNASDGLRETVENAAQYFKKLSGCEGVGIRLRKGDHFPFYYVLGLPQNFIAGESGLKSEYLKTLDEPVLSGEPEKGQPCFTPKGSFWTGNISELVTESGVAEQPDANYESAALIALRLRDEKLGFLCLQDKRRGRIALEDMIFWERLAGYLAVAIKKARAEEAMRESEEKFRASFANAAIGFAITTTDGRFIDANPVYCSITGFSIDELRGLRVSDLIHPEDVESNTRMISRMLSGELPDFVIENRFRRKDGSFVWVRKSVSVVRSTDGAPTWMIALVEDITERKKAEEVSRRYDLLASNTRDIILFVEQGSGRILEANQAAVSGYGYTRSELQQMHISDLRAAECRDSTAAQMVQAGEKGIQFETVHRRKDGSTFPVEVSSRGAVFGDFRMLISVIRDITQRKLAEEQMREMAQRLMYHVDHSPLAVIESGPDMTLIRWSGAAERLFGWKAEEVLGKHMEDFRWIHEEDQTKVEEVTKGLQTGASPHRISANRNYRKDGSVVYCEWYNSSLFDDDGKLRSILSLALDVTERRNAEEGLRESEQRYRLLFDRNPDGVFVLDRRGCFQVANPACEAIFGFSFAEILGSSFASMVAPDRKAETMEQIERCLLESTQIQLETSFVRKDGRHVELWISGEALVSGGKPIAIHCTAKDITAHKRAEEDRIVLSKLESTAILAGGIAHDFNNFLSAVTLNLDLVQANIDTERDVMVYLETARDSAASARNLTKQLIVFAKGGAPDRKPVLLSETISQSSIVAVSGSNVRADVSIERDLYWTEADENQIGQMIRNLVLNARDAMPSGGIVTVRASNVTLPCEQGPALSPGNYVQISVTDSGRGIAPEVLPRIFDPYFSTKQRGSDRGTGLGLTICQTIISKHNGTITVRSQEGVGSTFEVYLPACPTPDSVSEDEKATASASAKSGRILVMDDEDFMRTAIGSVLEAKGFQAELARDGAEAIELYSKALASNRRFDVVMLDLTIRGGMGGREAMAQLLIIDPAVKAVVMSGYSEDPILTEPEKYGFKAAMEKSFDIEQLIAMLKQII